LDTESEWKNNIKQLLKQSSKTKIHKMIKEPTTKRVQKLNICFVESKQREHLFRNFISIFTVLSPRDNISNGSPIKALNK